MTWQLEDVGTVLEEMDEQSGVYVTIHRVEKYTNRKIVGELTHDESGAPCVQREVTEPIVRVRLDLMRAPDASHGPNCSYRHMGGQCDCGKADHEPIRSFIGHAGRDVARATIRYCADNGITLSNEHAAYIGWECVRAELTEGYEQD